nr:hypothetical protein BaRGS_017110 [Batillaria attramentaria]
MSRLYDTVEPSVVDEEMLLHAVEEQGPKEEAGKIAKSEGMDFGDVTALRLDFKNILKIDGLWEFTRLTKLQLDNNIIEKIEGMDMLVNLVWLDLSFNNIEVIEGLDCLTKLTDLTLYNNRISRMENMDTLVDLQVFSIGNNDLKELENITYLRRFKKLKTLNLSNNPFCEFDNYKQYVAAFLPHLEFLDYRLLDDQDIPQIFQYGLGEHQKRDAEVAMFWECVEEAKSENKELGMKAVDEFMAEKKKMFADLSQVTDPKLLETRIQEYNTRVTELWDKLMGYELQLVDQLEEVIQNFDRNMQDMLFVDKDTINNAVSSSHDVHLLKIDNKEDDIVTRINNWLKHMIETIHEEQEIKRNRQRVTEINHLIDHLREEIDNLDVAHPY